MFLGKNINEAADALIVHKGNRLQLESEVYVEGLSLQKMNKFTDECIRAHVLIDECINRIYIVIYRTARVRCQETMSSII